MSAVGYETYRDRTGAHEGVFSNPRGMFPRIVLQSGGPTAVHIKVASVADFADVWRIKETIQGEPGGPYRRVRASNENGTELWAAERWGYTGYAPPAEDAARAVAMQRLLEAFLTRDRDVENDDAGFAAVSRII